MEHFTFDALQVGQTAAFTAEVAEADMDAFCRLSGDVSPIHLDAAYAHGRGFPGRVVYGMLVASYFSTLAGTYLPGEHCLLHSVNAKFPAPVFIGDTLTITGTIAEKYEAVRLITIKGIIKNQHGKTVCRGEIQAGVAK